MDGKAILQKVQETYLTLQTYCDIGTAYRVPAIGKRTQTEFKTHFARPDMVRFAWRDWHRQFGKPRYSKDSMIWTDGNYSGKHFLGKSENVDSFRSALAGATGVSKGSVLMVIPLLLPQCIEYNYKWQQMGEIRSLGDEEVAGALCYHLRGTAVTKNDSEAWIDKDNFLVRRLRWHQKPKEYHEYNYLQVATNEPLPDDLFVGSQQEAW